MLGGTGIILSKDIDTPANNCSRNRENSKRLTQIDLVNYEKGFSK
jgi:hypothetical protein